jgi:hypothetical protein
MQMHASALVLIWELRRMPTVRYPKDSKLRHYVFMGIVGVLKGEIPRYHKHVLSLIVRSVILSAQQQSGRHTETLS